MYMPSISKPVEQKILRFRCKNALTRGTFSGMGNTTADASTQSDPGTLIRDDDENLA